MLVYATERCLVTVCIAVCCVEMGYVITDKYRSTVVTSALECITVSTFVQEITWCQ
jgi:hypothetical protein